MIAAPCWVRLEWQRVSCPPLRRTSSFKEFSTAVTSTIHPHPTLSESVAMAAEVYEGTITDLYMPKKK
jgi:hypothetical protein